MANCKKTYRLPDGKITTSANKMVKAWKALYEPLLAVFPNLKIMGCDPGIQFSFSGRVFTLPPEFVAQIRDVIKDRDDFRTKYVVACDELAGEDQ